MKRRGFKQESCRESKALRPLQMALEEEEARALRACTAAEEATEVRNILEIQVIIVD